MTTRRRDAGPGRSAATRARLPAGLVATLLVGALLASCGSMTASSPPSTPAPRSDGATSPALGGELLVSAAASLTDAFGAVARSFEADHPQVEVVLNLAGSSALREQLLEGAPVDVFASADAANMDQVTAAGLTDGEPRVFATNRLQIAVPAGNPAGVDGLDAFADGDLLLGLCAADVPCGGFARQALDRAGVVPRLDTEEPDVRALLTKVELDELDAGITYVTDVIAAGGRVDGVDIPEAFNVEAAYPVAVLAAAPHAATAAAFVDFVLGPPGRAILAEYGFSPP